LSLNQPQAQAPALSLPRGLPLAVAQFPSL
jgi:hypothetical protein